MSVQTGMSARRCDSFGGCKLPVLSHKGDSVYFRPVCGNNSTKEPNGAFYAQSCVSRGTRFPVRLNNSLQTRQVAA